jgi:hypothetical protein
MSQLQRNPNKLILGHQNATNLQHWASAHDSANHDLVVGLFSWDVCMAAFNMYMGMGQEGNPNKWTRILRDYIC